MNDRELHLGDMTTQELAEWFGISYTWFKKTSKRKYQELEEYCKYQKTRGKVTIFEIYCNIYIKEPSLYNRVKEYTKINWRLEEPESAVRVAACFLRDNPDVTSKQSTIEEYARRARKHLWGSAKDLTPGTQGGCHYVFVKMYKGATQASNTYQLMSEEEYDKFALLQKKYFNIEPVKLAIALNSVRSREWSTETAMDFLFDRAEKRDKNYCAFVAEVSAALSCNWMVKATYAKNGVYYIEEQDESGNSYYREVQMETPGAF